MSVTYSRFRLRTVCSMAAFALITIFSSAPAYALTEAQQDTAIAGLQSAVSSLQSQVNAQQTTISMQQTTITALTAKLQFVTASGHDLTLTGNLHVVSGSGKTNSAPNGLGNVIIGYNELRPGNGAINDRAGSHCLILGSENNYTSYGGIVAGFGNTTSAGYASVAGGFGNTASATYSTVGGGNGLIANSNFAFLPTSASAATLQTFQTQINSLQNTVTTQGKLTDLFTISTDPTRSDGKMNTEVTLTGVNLHIVNGLGATNGEPANPFDTANPVVNGLGNLFIGYNTLIGNSEDLRTGSHNLIVGDLENYSSYGGIVAGQHNAIGAPYASVTGGNSNSATGVFSSITGGVFNTATSDNSSVTGGFQNRATGLFSSVSGGNSNNASGRQSSVSGGFNCTAAGSVSSVSGGSTTATATDFGWAAGTLQTP